VSAGAHHGAAARRAAEQHPTRRRLAGTSKAPGRRGRGSSSSTHVHAAAHSAWAADRLGHAAQGVRRRMPVAFNPPPGRAAAAWRHPAPAAITAIQLAWPSRSSSTTALAGVYSGAGEGRRCRANQQVERRASVEAPGPKKKIGRATPPWQAPLGHLAAHLLARRQRLALIAPPAGQQVVDRQARRRK